MKQTNLTDEDAAAIGRAFMEKLPENVVWSECPTEYVTTLHNRVSDLEAEVKAFDPDPVVCGCREAACPHTPVAKLPRQELVDFFRRRIGDLETELRGYGAR